jgi:hypothetical protein
MQKRKEGAQREEEIDRLADDGDTIRVPFLLIMQWREI